MAIVKKGTLTVLTGGVAQNLNLGFVPSYYRMVNKTIQTSGTVTGVTNVEWWNDMANASAYITTYTTGSGVLSYISTNGVTPYQTPLGQEFVPLTGLPAGATNVSLTITGISKAANASITATHAFTAADIGVTTVGFHNVVGMTQINTLTGVIQSVTSTTSFTVNINTTNFTTYTSGGIATIITGVPPTTQFGFQVENTPLYNVSFIGLTLGTTLMVNTSDVWDYLALLDTDITSY
jgi:hypothetical protein